MKTAIVVAALAVFSVPVLAEEITTSVGAFEAIDVAASRTQGQMTCYRPVAATCTQYGGGGLTPSVLRSYQMACVDGTWSADPCPTSRVGSCRSTSRADAEEPGITQETIVYESSGETEATADVACQSGRLLVIGLPGTWSRR